MIFFFSEQFYHKALHTRRVPRFSLGWGQKVQEGVRGVVPPSTGGSGAGAPEKEVFNHKMYNVD